MTSIRWPLVSLVAAIFALATALWSAPAAELVTAEVDGSVPIDVTVERGATAPFTIYVSATGSINCSNTAANPSTAKVHTSYAVSNAGAVTSSVFSGVLNFYATGSGSNCPITWADPDPGTLGLQAQTVSASVTVGSSTPLGNYSIALGSSSGRVAVTNPNSSGGKLDDNTATTLIFHVIAPAPPTDTTPPVVVPHATPSPNANGWNNGDVSVTWSVTDAESTVTSSTGCGPSLLTNETAGQTLTCSATSAGGTATQSVTVRIDKTAPAINGSRSPGANASGWNNTDVAVSFTCSDTGSVQSGISTNTVAGATVSGEGSAQSVTNSGACIDKAGNAASPATVGAINIDKTAPVISGSRAPEANANGWNNSDLAVSFSCADTGSVQSGIATSTVSGATVSGEGAGQSVTNSGACSDNAGNAASPATISGINIDKTPPQISGSRSPEANTTGWNNTDVTVSFDCADTGVVPSGIATDTLVGATLTGEVTGQSVTNSGACVDNAGNAASPATVGGINIDKTSPVVSGSRAPGANANGWNNTDVTVSFTCAEAGTVQSGIASDTVAGGTVSGEGSGQSLTNSGDCIDNAGNAASPATVGAINIDKTAPVISGSRDPEANASGWTNTDVAVSFICADTGSVQSDIATDTVAGATVSGEGAGQSVTNSGDCVDNAGNAAISVTMSGINIDKTAPVISGSRDPEANGNGWNNADVTVSFTCSDTGAVQSGIASDTVAGDTLTDEGAGQSVTNSGACVDNAGNVAIPATVGGINIDKTNPAITGGRDPGANGNGWNNTDVTVSFACADSGAVQSGIATDTVAGDTLTGEGAGQSVTNGGACIDNAGNAAVSATVGGVNIDKTAPQVSGSRSPVANTYGWNNTNVTVHYDCTDSLSLVGFVTADQVVSAEGAGQSRFGTCIDKAGNSASTSVLNINIDKTSPTVAITGFSDGDVFHTGQSVPGAGCATPKDSLSGVASSNGPSLIAGGLNANGVGYVGYGCSATDRAGNAASDTAGFSVSYGGVTGILQPINPDNSSVFKRGQAVPVKFRLVGDEFSGFATGSWALKRILVSCSTLADLTVVENVSSVTPSSSFRYDPSADQYIYNADFRSIDAGTCWRIKVTLDDGTVLYSAYFKVSR